MLKKLILFVVLLVLYPGISMARDYVVGDGDLLKVSVWGVPEMSVEVIVRPDGKITMPAVGDVSATGLTPQELSRDLTKVLDSYVKKPIVTVTVSGITNNRVYISGGGVTPRVMPLSGRTTLFKAMCGLEDIQNADLKRAFLMRDGEKLEVDFYALFIDGDLENDLDLQTEDILFLPTNEKNKVYVIGAVNEPKYIIYREGMRILDAVFECGGFTKYAKASAVLILRTKDDKEANIKINIEDLMDDGDLEQNIELLRGDYVIVKEGLF